jgi:hypothetical protein
MTLTGLTTSLINHLSVVNLRLAMLEGSEPQAAADASLDLMRRILLEAGMTDQEAEITLVSPRELLELVVSRL